MASFIAILLISLYVQFAMVIVLIEIKLAAKSEWIEVSRVEAESTEVIHGSA